MSTSKIRNVECGQQDGCDGYTSTPTHLRIWRDEWAGWCIDGADDSGHYTEAIWSYDSYAEALAAIEDFIHEANLRGVFFDWRTTAQEATC